MRLLATIFLAMILGGSAQAQPPVPALVNAPAGVKLHYTGTDIEIDGAGVLYGRTRGTSERGEIVWRVEDGQSIVVLEPGPASAFGNGHLRIFDGMGYLVTVTEKSNQVSIFPVPGWVKVP